MTDTERNSKKESYKKKLTELTNRAIDELLEEGFDLHSEEFYVLIQKKIYHYSQEGGGK